MRLPELQFALLEAAEAVAIGNAVPIVWDGNASTLPAAGIDAVLADGVEGARRGGGRRPRRGS